MIPLHSGTTPHTLLLNLLTANQQEVVTLINLHFQFGRSLELHLGCVCVCASLSHVRLFAATQTVACQASLSMEFSRQEYWGGLPLPSPEELPKPGIKPWSSALQSDSLPFELQGSLLT